MCALTPCLISKFGTSCSQHFYVQNGKMGRYSFKRRQGERVDAMQQRGMLESKPRLLKEGFSIGNVVHAIPGELPGPPGGCLLIWKINHCKCCSWYLNKITLFAVAVLGFSGSASATTHGSNELVHFGRKCSNSKKPKDVQWKLSRVQ